MTDKTRNLMLLFGILLLSSGLYTARIGQEGFGNHYYAAAARSMLSSPSNFFFGSFDARGFVSVDKPPAGLWMQSLFILFFGFNSFAIMLPSILAGIISVFLLYHIVRDSFGENAGLSAAFILAVTPVFAALSRNNTMDAMLISFLLLAVRLFQKGLDSGKLRYFLSSAALMGFAFNIKMVQAFVILPALFLVFLLYYKPGLPVKILHTILVSALLLALSFSWGFAVELTPEDRRPYMGGSVNNSALELMIDYNGLDRVREYQDETPGVRNYYVETGKPGFFRLFNKLIGGQAGWFIPFAVMGALLFIWQSRKGKSLQVKEKRDMLFWGTWFLTLYAYLSYNTGFFHTHYIAMICPALAALGGIGVAGCLRASRSGNFLRWFPPGIIVLSMAFQGCVAREFAEWNRPMTIAMAALSGLSACIMIFSLFEKREALLHKALLSGLLGLAILPFSWALTPILYGGDPGIPYARPDLRDMKIGVKYFQINNRDKAEYKRLLSFLNENRRGEEYLVGVKSALADGAGLMLQTDGDIMTLGGFSGTDPILSMEEIEAFVQDGRIRYFLMTSGGSLLNRASFWVMGHGKMVPDREWRREGDLEGMTLYDCRPDKK